MAYYEIVKNSQKKKDQFHERKRLWHSDSVEVAPEDLQAVIEGKCLAIDLGEDSVFITVVRT